MEVLKVENLYKKIGKHRILKDINIAVGEREIVGFLGPNGSGKSTTLKCICGLYRATAGRITVNGYDITKNRKEALNSMGVSIEAPALYPQLTGREHLKMMGGWRNASRARVKEMEEYSGLGIHLDKAVQGYSMGMKMRLMLSLTLIAKPKLLILDEPTNGLDPQAVFELREQMEAIRQEGSSILYSSHQLNEVEKLSDRVILINHGSKVFDGSIREDAITSNRYLMKVSDPEKSIRVLMGEERKAGPLVERENNHIVIFVKEEEQFNRTLSLLNQNQIAIYDIVRHEISLEDFYKEIYEGRHGNAALDKE